MTAAHHEISAPRSEPCPAGISCNYIVDIENCAVFSKCNYLVRAGIFKQFRELCILCAVASFAGINVLADNIYIIISGLPVRVLTVPNPYEVRTAIDICKLIVEVVPELFVSL